MVAVRMGEDGKVGIGWQTGKFCLSPSRIGEIRSPLLSPIYQWLVDWSAS